MPLSVEQLAANISEAIEPGFRGRLVSRGLSRSILWSDGLLPTGAPSYAPSLSQDLQAYGLGIFSLCLQLREVERDHPLLSLALERSAEAVEAVVRRGDPELPERGFLTIIAASAYHLGHFSARAFSLFAGVGENLNLSPSEQILKKLFVRDLNALRAQIHPWTENVGFDSSLARSYHSGHEQFSSEWALQLLLNALFHRAFASFEHALETGSSSSRDKAIADLRSGGQAANDFQHVTFWWLFTIAQHLLDDLWNFSLHVRIPDPMGESPDSNWSRLRRLFVATLAKRKLAEIELWPSQWKAAERALDVNDDLIVSLPTSAGKTRVAEICILRTLSLGQRVIFVTPLRALSAQTERILRRKFVPLGFSVSSLYGSSGMTGEDLDSLANRDIVVSTPEKLDFALRNNPSLLDAVGLIVLDEGHSIGLEEREVRYEVLMQRLLKRPDAIQRRIVCLSALLPSGEELNDFVAWLRQDQSGDPITSAWRPTRQRFGEIVWQGNRATLTFRVDSERPYVLSFVTEQPPLGKRKKAFPQNSQEFILATAWRFVDQGQTVLIYCPLKKSVEPLAEMALTLNRQGYLPSLLNQDVNVLNDAMNIGSEWLGANHPAVQCLPLGIAIHHGSLPRPFQRAVERLLHDRVLSITIASPTLAQGLNLSATTLLFHSIYRHKKTLPTEEFVNIAGRAGRAFVDVEGQVICVDFENKLRRPWEQLLKSAQMRSVRSGLLRLVLHLCDRLQAGTKLSLEEVTDYVTGNVIAWDAPTPTGEEPHLAESWNAELGRLDSAILALVPHETTSDDVPRVLDEVLSSSLWQRSLQRSDETTQRMANALLQARANYIWERSNPVQRKGAFFAGVSFNTGIALGENSAVLNTLLLEADTAFESGAIIVGVMHILEFARTAFAIQPFVPDELPYNWEHIVTAWILGENFSDLAEGIEAKVVQFLESAVVYRLVWALEAVRVRAIAMEELTEDAFNGRTAMAVETGTPNYAASLLIHCGFASRIAAIKAVRDAQGDFHDVPSMRIWLESEKVQRLMESSDWPTAATASLWREFARSFHHERTEQWDVYPFTRELIWQGQALSPGNPVRIPDGISVYSVTWEPVGNLRHRLDFDSSGILFASVGTDGQTVTGEFVGPRGAFRSVRQI